MKKAFSKSLSWLLSVVMIFGMFVVSSVSVSAVSEEERIKQQIVDAYSWARSSYGGSFTNACPSFVKYNLAALGIVDLNADSDFRGNGNQFVNNIQEGKTSKGYTKTKYYGNDCLSQIINANGGGNVYNIVVSWTHQYGYSNSSPGAGHVCFIHAILNGTVYMSDNYTYAGKSEGSPLIYSLSDFMSRWNGMYGNAINAVHLTNVHVHNYTEYVYNSSAHPHYKCYRCSCGDVQENRNEPTFSDTCAECIDSVPPKGHVMSESEAAGQTIPDGDYYVVNGINPDYFLDISGDSFDTPNGTNLQMWIWGSSIPNSAGYDCFHFEYLNNGFYKITQMGTNMCIDVCGGSLERGTNIYMWNDNGNDAQQWSVEKTTHGYRFRSKCNAYYLDVYGAEHAGGTNIWCWDSNNAEPQSFGLIPRDLNENPVADGVYIIRPNVSNQHFLDIAGTPDEFHAGSNVQIWRSADSAEEDKFAITYVGDGWYKITEQTSGLALALSDTEENFLNEFKNVQLSAYNGGKNQLWKIRENSDGTYSIINKTSGHYLDLYYSKTDNGTNVSQFTYNGNNSQKWTFELDVSVNPDKKGNFNGHTYEYYNCPLKWFDAYRFCEKKGGHLVTITSKEEDDFISDLVQDSSVWTGGRTFDNSPWMWITGESFDYQNWGWNQPDNYNDSEDALQYSISDQGTVYWNDAPRNTTLTFICEYDNTIDISKYIPAYKTNYNGHEYWYFENRVDWQTAKKVCELKGGYLAIPNNEGENAVIVAGLQNTSNAWAWIGITDIAQEGIWKDVKGNVIQYTNWSSPQPDNYGGREDYVHMYNDGTWNDANCGCNCCNNVGFVCEFDDLCTGSGHKYEETIVAPTTTKQGYTLHTCSVCKHSYKDNYTNILLSNNSTLSAETIKLGETITATAKATGGTGEYLYQVVYKQTTQSKWTTAQSYKANATVTFKPANAVTYDVCVKVKDSNNTEVKKFFTVKVTSDELKNVSTISAQTINLGSTVTVNAKATGSTGFYTYAVYYKQKAQTKWTTKQDFKANNTIAVKPAKATTYDICVKVKDDKGTIVKKYFTVNVTDFTNTSTLSATEIKLGNTVKVSCSATGSTGYYQYAVYYKKTSDTKWTTKQSYSSNNTVTIKPAKATTYDVCVKVKDNQNNEVKKYFTVTVK